MAPRLWEGNVLAQMSELEKRLIAELNAIKEKHLAGLVVEAERAYSGLLKRYPSFIGALHPHGIALQQLGRHEEAAQTIRRWLAVMPDDVDAMINLANSLTASGRLPEAVEVCRKAVAVRPGSEPARAALAQAEALSAPAGVTTPPPAPAPVSLEVLFAQANKVADQGRSEDAIRLYQEILAINPDLPEVLVNLGNQLFKSQRASEAVGNFERALKLRPGMREALLNMGNALHDLGEHDRALDCYEKALKSDPTYRDALNNLANIHLNQNRPDKALPYARRLLKLYPDHVQAHGTAAGLLLARGELKEGWEHYEWRWLKPGLPVPLRDFGCPDWAGEDISGKTILLSHEQGLGDSIQFVRFVSEVVKRAGNVILEVPANLMALYAPVPGVTLAPFAQPLPPYDVQLPLMSLPHVLGVTLDNLPTPIPYLQAEPERVERWRDRLPQGGFRIGIVWQGKAGTSVDKGRSYALQHLAPVARIPGVTLISLQKGYGLDQLDNLPDGMKVVTLGPDFDEGGGAFLDTAAVMSHMDLIISSDTSVAHLAGALGRPVWVPLKLSPDWRWMLDREDCPWYPTMRLFRQRQIGDWPQVFERLAAEVTALKEGDSTRLLPPPAPPLPLSVPYPPVPRPPLPAVCQPALRSPQHHAKPVGDGVMEVQTRHGRLRYPANDPTLGRSLDAYGEWAEAEVDLCAALLREGDRVVEVGADIGCHTLALARAVGATGLVQAFEPREALHNLLTLNVEASGLSQIVPHRTAFTPTVTIDSLQLDRLRLLKAKVESGPLDLIRGAVDTIGRCRPILYLGQEEDAVSPELLTLLTEQGYSLWWHKPLMFRSNNFLGNNIDIFPGLQSVNLLCIPKERDAVVVGLDRVQA